MLKSVRDLTIEEIERDISEINADIEFICDQFLAECNEYNSNQVKDVELKIFFIRQKRSLLKAELDRRKREEGILR